jgi:hypothetical protein
MQYKKNNDVVLFKVLAKVAPVSLVIIMMMLIAGIYHTSQKAIAQVTVPYPSTSYYPYPSTSDVYPYSIYPYNLFLPYPTPYTAYPYPTPYTAYPYPYPYP